MLRFRAALLLAPVRNPFKLLGLPRTATKAEVKSKYRELARVYHPDNEGGDSGKMEEVNHAYRLLMKEGGYERLHLRGDSAAAGRMRGSVARPVGVTAEGRRTRKDGVPFTSDQEHGGEDDSADFDYERPAEEAALSDEEVERLGSLDPSTERRSPTGKYLYRSRDDGSWVELEKPLLKAHQPRYASFKAKADMNAELRRRAVSLEKELNERTAFQRAADRLTDSADLPTNNPHLLKLYLVVLSVTLYFAYQRTFARKKHQRGRSRWYQEMDARREDLNDVYRTNKDGLEVTVVAAALILLAASTAKVPSDPIVEALPDAYFESVKPPPEHFNVVAGG